MINKNTSSYCSLFLNIDTYNRKEKDYTAMIHTCSRTLPNLEKNTAEKHSNLQSMEAAGLPCLTCENALKAHEYRKTMLHTGTCRRRKQTSRTRRDTLPHRSHRESSSANRDEKRFLPLRTVKKSAEEMAAQVPLPQPAYRRRGEHKKMTHLCLQDGISRVISTVTISITA